MKYSGERLVVGDQLLDSMRVENLARFDFFRRKVSGSIILDLGCGVGEGTSFLSNHDPRLSILGIDISFDSIHYARQNSPGKNLCFACMDITNLAIKDSTFDAIVSIEVIEHITDVKRYLGEAYRVLKPGGLLFLTTPNRLISSPAPSSLWPDHVVEYSPSELDAVLSNYFSNCELFGESVPVYETNPVRKLVHRVAPHVKPLLPKWLRIRALPLLFSAIKKNITISDIEITTQSIDTKPTIIACCYKP